MTSYIVTYSARKAGAAGIFYPVKVEVEAECAGDAKLVAFDKLQPEYETNYPISVEKKDQ